MFVLTTVTDRIRVAAAMLSMPTLTALHNEIDLKYPNRILMNVGLVICRYGSCLKLTNGSCVPGDGGPHHECLFRLVVFRPFVDEVCVGKIVKSTPEGLQVSLGNFYHDIFIPAYWMLRPSRYSEELGLWAWTPDYGNEDDDEDLNNDSGNDITTDNDPGASVKREDVAATSATNVKEEEEESSVSGGENKTEEEEEEGEQFEMELGAEIRFKIKSIHFTQVTNTAKGVQATTTTTAHSQGIPKESEEGKSLDARPLRKRSLSVEISDMSNLPASMNIVASICEDGLGLTSWWNAGEDNDEEEEENEEAEV